MVCYCDYYTVLDELEIVFIKTEPEYRNRGYATRLMKELGLKCMVRIKKYRSYKGRARPVRETRFCPCREKKKLLYGSQGRRYTYGS